MTAAAPPVESCCHRPMVGLILSNNASDKKQKLAIASLSEITHAAGKQKNTKKCFRNKTQGPAGTRFHDYRQRVYHAASAYHNAPTLTQAGR